MFCANWRLSSGGKILSSKTYWAHGATVLSSVGKSQTDTLEKTAIYLYSLGLAHNSKAGHRNYMQEYLYPTHHYF